MLEIPGMRSFRRLGCLRSLLGIGCHGVAQLLRCCSNDPDRVINVVGVLRGVGKGIGGQGQLASAQRPAIVQLVHDTPEHLPGYSGKAASESEDGFSYK